MRKSEAALTSDTTDVLFDPSPDEVLSYLFGHYLSIFIYQIVECESQRTKRPHGGHEDATDNAGLDRRLTLEYNKLRQGNITKELLEIAGGQLGNG